ncbi:MAG: hypothetical protein KDB79_04835 [Acidobacteria bacterium]|nr:hypothetical protein [Acidobacteriota bacterium]
MISNLSKTEQKKLFEDLFYLHTAELFSFCDRHRIPYKILIETNNGELKTTRDRDRKKIVLRRITHFLKTGEISKPTVFVKGVVELSGLPDVIGKDDRIFYGCYEKKNPKMIALLSELTGGRYRNGAVARILLRDFWARGEAPTFVEFAKVWEKAAEEYSLDQHPEAAYLTDRSKGTAGGDWKTIRDMKASRVLRILERL